MQVPLEVTNVLEAKKDSLTEKLQKYLETRAREWAGEHQRYLSSIDPQAVGGPRLQTFRESLAAAYLGVKPRNSAVYDKRMMFLGCDQLFHILTPLAQRVMIDVSNPTSPAVDLEAVAFVTTQVFSDKTGRYTGDVKGRVLEQYIIDTVGRSKQWIATATKEQARKSRQPLKLDMRVEINSEAVFFTGSGVPPQHQSLDWARSMLFDPKLPNYPAVDLLIWAAHTKTLYAIQVTIQPLGAHMKNTLQAREAEGAKRSSKWDELRGEWAQVLPDGSTIELVWLADNDRCNEEYKQQQWIVLTQNPQLHQHFPLLSELQHEHN